MSLRVIVPGGAAAILTSLTIGLSRRVVGHRRMERVVINVQMSGFGDEAEILCSTRALPVLTRLGEAGIDEIPDGGLRGSVGLTRPTLL